MRPSNEGKLRKGKPQRLDFSPTAKEEEEPRIICGGDIKVFIESNPATPYIFLALVSYFITNS
jgi:hypothetical protein